MREPRDERQAALKLAACTGPCEQGRRLCPTPDACRIPEPDLPLTGGDWWLAVGIVGACIFFVCLGPMTINFVRGLFA